MSRLALHLVDAELDAFAVADDIKWKQLAARTEAERKQRAVMPKQGTPHLWVFWLHPGELVADLEAIVDDRIDADREDDALPLRVARWTDSQTLGAVLDTPRDDRSEQADISKLDMLARTAEHRLRGTGGWAHERRRVLRERSLAALRKVNRNHSCRRNSLGALPRLSQEGLAPALR